MAVSWDLLTREKINALPRDECISYLVWNDPQGRYSDADLARDGFGPMTEDEARDMLIAVRFDEDRDMLIAVYP